MRYFTAGFYAVTLAAAMAFAAQAQERSREAVAGESPVSSSLASQGARAASAPIPQDGPYAGTASTVSNSNIPAGAGASQSQPALNYPQVPNLKGTSFGSINAYVRWEIYSDYMQSHFMMDPFYFRRFYRNVEPLITPEMLRMSTSEPLQSSTLMLASAEELRALIAILKAGGTVSKKDIAARTQAIRKLAGRIRKDQSLLFLDQRKKTDILKGQKPESLGIGAIEQLCAIAADLHSQLAGMNRQTATSTISVHTLTQPSIESLSSGIEKLAKVIEDSARQI